MLVLVNVHYLPNVDVYCDRAYLQDGDDDDAIEEEQGVRDGHAVGDDGVAVASVDVAVVVVDSDDYSTTKAVAVVLHLTLSIYQLQFCAQSPEFSGPTPRGYFLRFYPHRVYQAIPENGSDDLVPVSPICWRFW